jgi:hypothetical protein
VNGRNSFNVREIMDDEKCHPPGRGSAFKHRCKGVQLPIQSSHLSAFLFGWHWDIGDIYIHSKPSSQIIASDVHGNYYEGDLKEIAVTNEGEPIKD